jgi:predicted dehydrogenase
VSDASSILKIAVVGAGLIGERHARLVNALLGFELCAIIDPSEHSRKIAKELSVSHFADLNTFLESGTECGGAIIATPNETHRAFALSCFDKGIACLIEKPLAANSEDAIAIAEACRRSNTPVLVGHHRRHHSVSRVLKEKIEHGDLGQLVGAQLTWMLRKPDDYFEAGEWRIQKGGGPIWINLIHEIDLLRYFMGDITEVSAFVSNAVRGNAVEDTGVINMRCKNGAVVSAILSDATPSPWHFEGGSGENPNIAKTGQSGLRIFGTKTSIEFPSLAQWQHDNDQGHWGTQINKTIHQVNDALDGETALTQQLKNFGNVIRGKEEPLVSAQDGVQSVRVVEAIHKSANDGSTVKISSF